MLILQCNCNSPIKKWDLSFHVCGWTYGYGGSDTLWLLWLVHKAVIQLLASVKMFPGKPSFHAVRKPKSHCGEALLERDWHHNMASRMNGPLAVGGEPPVPVKLPQLMLNGEKQLGSTELCSNGRVMSKTLFLFFRGTFSLTSLWQIERYSNFYLRTNRGTLNILCFMCLLPIVKMAAAASASALWSGGWKVRRVPGGEGEWPQGQESGMVRTNVPFLNRERRLIQWPGF